MRIGILTFHCAHNYGAVLQCYALQETLKSMGHEVEVIDYLPDFLTASYRRFSLNRFLSKNPFALIKKTIREFWLLDIRIKRYAAFNNFICSRLYLSKRVNGKSIPQDYDIYIMGSDQIWNPRITKGFDLVYFGGFQFAKGKRKYISYAASMGFQELSDSDKRFCASALQNFDSISVREFQTASLLQPLISKKIETVIDPTLLVDVKIWEAMAVAPRIGKKYVLVYQIGVDHDIIRLAKKIAKEINAVVVEVMAWAYPRKSRYRMQCATPEEFLGWVKYASCIVTTSFHGTAFSVIFNRPFYNVTGDRNDVRSRSLLKSLGLENRIITKNSSSAFSEIDYNDANRKIYSLQSKSKNFIKKAVEYI